MPSRFDIAGAKARAPKDGDNTASVSASVSLRTVMIIGVVTALTSGAVPSCTTAERQDRIIEKLDELNTRVSRIEGALQDRHASRNDGTRNE